MPWDNAAVIEDLADAVLPLIRTRSDLHRWSAANAHGKQMHEGVDILQAALGAGDSRVVFAVTTRAIASACAVIARADDSRGIIGDACRRLLNLHPRAAAAARPPVRQLVDWMIKFQFDGVVDFFVIDPVKYADALGEAGIAAYREALDRRAAALGARPTPSQRWESGHSHEWFVLEWNERRLAVLDRDIDAIIATHLRGGTVAAWYQDVAEALAEIGEFDLAIDWARRGTEFDDGFQALNAGRYWCRLVAEHHPEQALDVALTVFRRWPTSGNAAAVRAASGDRWPQVADEVLGTLSADPREAVIFALNELTDVHLAWSLAQSLGLPRSGLHNVRLWSDLVKKYETIDPLAALAVHRDLVEGALEVADAVEYRRAARRLATMRRLAAGTGQDVGVDAFIADLREQHRRRPRLQAEFDRAGLP